VDDDEELVRCWVEFDLTGHGPTTAEPGLVSIDGGTLTYRLLHRGIGVTGYDQADCLALIQQLIGDEPLPPLLRIDTDVDVDALGVADEAGVPVWRGIWFPRHNIAGPAK
jgi:hypothetical protein